MEWQNISTAPKDGTPIYAWSEEWDRPALIIWRVNPRSKVEGWNDMDEQDTEEELQKLSPPTHWVFLPQSPAK